MLESRGWPEEPGSCEDTNEPLSPGAVRSWCPCSRDGDGFFRGGEFAPEGCRAGLTPVV